MASSELESRNISISMRKSVENLVISSQDAIGQSISQALTFSGVITHSTQILQENRSISRSPSPSLRISESAPETVDNDKSSESLTHASLAADNVSVSSAELPTAVLRADTAKGTSKAEGAGRGKKKSWYNAFYPTYKSKSDDFKRLFKDLPEDERLIVDYSCALQKDILAHGRLYASQNYLCFYANIFGWETNMVLRWKDVTAITKEKTALVIPNAILICTAGEKNFLASFSGRDKAYLMLFRIWQNALMGQSMTSHDIWHWVHSCYGEELGFNSDDEEYSRDLVEEVPLPIEASEDLVDSTCMEAGGGALREDQRQPRGSSRGRDSSPPLVSNGDGAYGAEAGDTLPTDMSDSSDTDMDNKHNGEEPEKCCNPHDGKLIMKATFPFNIDQMFTMIFTNSKFNLELLAARGTRDYVQSPWQVQNGRKCRQISYTLGLTSGPIGPKEVHVSETQVMNKCSKPGVQYSIDCTSENSGIPYADYFAVCVHYCLQRRTRNSTELAFYGRIDYKKTMWPMVKSFLEKNSVSGLEDFCRTLEARLLGEAPGAATHVRKARRPRHHAVSASPLGEAGAAAGAGAGAGAARGAGGGGRWLLAAVAVLLALNALLYSSLYYGGGGGAAVDLQELHDRLGALQSAQAGAWRRQLERLGARHRAHAQRWRSALADTAARLRQTEQALTKLLETIKPSLEKAQREAEIHPDEL